MPRQTKMISGHFDPAISRQIKLLAVNHDCTVQSLMLEAFMDLFCKYKVDAKPNHDPGAFDL